MKCIDYRQTHILTTPVFLSCSSAIFLSSLRLAYFFLLLHHDQRKRNSHPYTCTTGFSFVLFFCKKREERYKKEVQKVKVDLTMLLELFSTAGILLEKIEDREETITMMMVVMMSFFYIKDEESLGIVAAYYTQLVY